MHFRSELHAAQGHHLDSKECTKTNAVHPSKDKRGVLELYTCIYTCMYVYIYVCMYVYIYNIHMTLVSSIYLNFPVSFFDTFLAVVSKFQN